MKRWLRWLLAVGLVVAVGFSIVGAAWALEKDDDGTIGADEVIDDDVMISWDTVVVDGTVNGDLFASGNSVTINGTINGNLLTNGDIVTVNGQVNGSMAAAGKKIILNGQVTGSTYVAAGEFVLEPTAIVGRNVIFTGLAIQTKEGSMVGRDLMTSSAQAQLAGQVEHDVEADASAVEIEGTVGGDVRAEVESPDESGGGFTLPGFGFTPIASGLRVAEGADIGGTLTYRSSVEQASGIQSTPAGGIVYVQDVAAAGPEAGFRVHAGKWIAARLRDIITLFVLGGLVIWKLPVLLRRVADQARSTLLSAAGWWVVVFFGGYVGVGVLGVLIVVLGILLAIVTLGGLAAAAFGVGLSGLGTAFALFMLMVAYGSKLVVAQVGGQALLRRFAPNYAEHRAWPLLLGLAIYVILRSIPILGWLFGAGVTLIGLGATWMTFRAWRAVQQEDVVA